MTTVNSAAEILAVRNMLSDAGIQMTEVVVDELRTSSDVKVVFVKYTQIHNVVGIWLSTDPTHAGTNYYDGGSFNAYTGELTLNSSLPDASTNVLINYTHYKGLAESVVDQHISFSKGFVDDYTGKIWDWADVTDPKTQVAKAAMTIKSAMIALAFMVAPEILQKGFNFRIDEFSVESKTWAGSMGLKDMLTIWNGMLQEHLDLLGKDLKFCIPSNYEFGYTMDSEGEVT